MKDVKIKDKFVIGLLKNFMFYDFLVKDGKYNRNQDFSVGEDHVLHFAYELLDGLLQKEMIKEFYLGFGKYHTGITSRYTYSQVELLIDLYFDLKGKPRLWEIGTKRCNKDLVMKILSEELNEEFEPNGTVTIYNDVRPLFEVKKSGVLVSSYVNEMDEFYMTDKVTGKTLGKMISSSSYMGIIVPSLALCHKLAKALYKRGDNTEIEWVYNRLGGICVRDLTRENVSPNQAEINKVERPKDYRSHDVFEWNYITKPKVIEMVTNSINKT